MAMILKSISHPRGFIFEQTCIGYELQKANMYKLLDIKWNNILACIYHAHNCYFSLKSFFETTYFLHFASGFGTNRISIDFPELIN